MIVYGNTVMTWRVLFHVGQSLVDPVRVLLFSSPVFGLRFRVTVDANA